MIRSIERATLWSVILFFILILCSGLFIAFSVAALQQSTFQLSKTTIPLIETSRDYDVAMTSAIASAQTYLVDENTDELDQADEALAKADTALHILQQFAQTDNNSKTAAEQKALISARQVIYNTIQQEATALRTTKVSNELQRDALLNRLEEQEQTFSALRDQQTKFESNAVDLVEGRVAQSFERLSLIMAIVVLILIAMLSGIFIMVRRWMVRPLVHMAGLTSAIGSGNYRIHIPHTGIAEVGQLQVGFAEMAKLLITRDASLLEQAHEAERMRRAAEEAQQRIDAQLSTILQQQEQIRAISVPVLPIGDDMFVMPLIGTFDQERLHLAQAQGLKHIEGNQIDTLLLDVTGIPAIDREVGHGLLQMVQAAKLLGTQVCIVGIRPEVAQTIVALGIELNRIPTFSTIHEGMARMRAPRHIAYKPS